MNRVADVERQLAAAQQITHIGSWEWDVAAGTVAWSDELYRIYGLEPRSREITVDYFLSRVHADDREHLQREVGAAIERGGRFQWIERIVWPDGSVHTLDTVGEVHRERAGGVVALIGTCRDVTQERERNEQIRLYADIVFNVQIGLSVWAVEGGAEAPRLLAYNPASERIARAPLEAFVGKGLGDIAPYAAGGVVESVLMGVARDRAVREASVERSRDPKDPRRALAIKGFPLPGDRVGLAVEDVTVQTMERRLQQGEQRVLEMIASGAPVNDSLATLVLAVEDFAPPALGSVLLLDPDGRHIRHGAGPNLPAAYMSHIDGSAIGPHAGSCGAAAFLKRAVIVTNIDTDPLWDGYLAVAREYGFRACWSVPILATDARVLGTFAFYYRAPRAPEAADLAIIERAARVAGIAIERKQLEDQLRDLSAHIESALEDERAGIAREIHDEIGQALTALKMDVAWIGRRAGDALESLPREALLEKLGAMSGLIDGVIHQVRRISAELRPGVLDDLGLVAAIEWQAQEFEARTGTTCAVHASASEASIGRNASTAVFRVFQEALTNVARHAQATHVDVRVDVSPATLALEVLDDGVGIAPEAVRNPKSLGLLGIRERAHRLGGTVTVGPAAPRGTRVALVVPVEGRAP